MRIVVLLMALSMCKPITSYAQIGWRHINPTMNGDTVTTAQLWDVYFINENHGFVVGRSTVLETTDGGDTWMHNDLESMLPNGAPLKSICFTDELHGWVAGWYGTVYRTVDGGRTWDDLSLPTQYDFEKVLFIDTKVGWLLGDSSIGTYFGGAGCILGTTDGGLSWDKTFFYPETNDDYRWSFFDIQMVTDQIGYAAGTYGGGAKTTDGGRSWTPLDIPWKVSSWSIHFYDINKGVMSGNRDEVYTQDGGLTWEWSSLPWGHTFDYHFTSDSTGYLVGSGLFQTSDAGATWVQQIVDGQFILSLKAIHFSDKYNGWAVGDHGRIIHTSDGGLVSVQENQMPREIELSISPQPSQVGQAIRMNWSLPQASELSLLLYDIYGRLRHTVSQGHCSAGLHERYVHEDTIGPGIYFLRLVADDAQMTKVLIIR
jgi:photosystem II stability/assembly factor-like uncharacterized protein